MELWIARDSDGELYLFTEKPIKNIGFEGRFWVSKESFIHLEKQQYPEVTFENSPMEVELKLVNNV